MLKVSVGLVVLLKEGSDDEMVITEPFEVVVVPPAQMEAAA